MMVPEETQYVHGVSSHYDHQPHQETMVRFLLVLGRSRVLFILLETLLPIFCFSLRQSS